MHETDLIVSKLAEDPHYSLSINAPFSYPDMAAPEDRTVYMCFTSPVLEKEKVSYLHGKSIGSKILLVGEEERRDAVVYRALNSSVVAFDMVVLLIWGVERFALFALDQLTKYIIHPRESKWLADFEKQTLYIVIFRVAKAKETTQSMILDYTAK
ncbi:protein BTR1-like isoform X2 [Quillaja saponaria]|uniref:Protein BTR1-like isoform X2 n=1 Tax=Quillaja saponaria TaxID=32244 RepID=A0AAD7P9C9_QUISA|nr:protein BTR1-like isoform X2 [Quillaja saponaria]